MYATGHPAGMSLAICQIEKKILFKSYTVEPLAGEKKRLALLHFLIQKKREYQ